MGSNPFVPILYSAARDRMRHSWYARARKLKAMEITIEIRLSERIDSMPKVLVVEDNVTSRIAMVHMLDRLGIKADSAANGNEAVQRMRQWRYELILMDIEMPEMDGFEATAAIRAHEVVHNLSPALIIAVSASGEKDRAIAVGMNDYLEKPATAICLLKIIDDWLPAEKRSHWSPE